MKNYNIFIDGSAGTTGLRIADRLQHLSHLTVIKLSDDERKNIRKRVDAINQADLSILCLPDLAAKEVVSLINPETKICDTSTAHRTHEQWVYGLAELHGQKELIAQSNKVAIPGCHATGFLLLTTPLVKEDVIASTAQLHCFSITGYSGGGKEMIAEFESPKRQACSAPELYGLSMQHKHLAEMQKMSGLTQQIIFNPIVADFKCGMLVTVVIPKVLMKSSALTLNSLMTFYQQYYFNAPLITIHSLAEHPQRLNAATMANRDGIELWIGGNEQQILLCARYDNLGKGASGAAIQCMNLMLGFDEITGLCL